MERAVPVLPADDIAVAKDFYVNKLGFKVAFEDIRDAATGMLGLERGSLYVIIDAPMSGHGRHACVSLQVESADAYYREWSERVPTKRPPKNEYWGGRTFDLEDPFGNTLFVVGPATPE